MDSRPTRPDLRDLLAQTDRLRGLIRRLVLDDATAEDVLQETYTTALRSPPRLAGDLGGWLRTVARHLAFKQRRSAQRRDRRERAAAQPEAQSPTLDVVAALEWQQRLTAAVTALDEPYRSTVVNRYLRGLEAKAIAELDGVTVGAVNARLRRGLHSLRVRFDREEEGGVPWRRALLPVLIQPTPPGPPASVGQFLDGALAPIVGGALLLVAGAVWVIAAAGPDVPPVDSDAGLSVSTSEGSSPAAQLKRPALAGAAPSAEADDVSPPEPDDGSRARRAADYLERINRQDVDATPGIVREILELGPEAARQVLVQVFPQIALRWKRLRCLEAVSGEPAHRYAIALLEPASSDPSPAVRGHAYERLAAFGFPVLADDRRTLEAWWRANRDRSVSEALEAQTITFVERLRHLEGHVLSAELSSQGPLDERLRSARAQGLDLGATFSRLGFPKRLAEIGADAGVPVDGRLTALIWLEQFDLAERDLAQHVRPLLLEPASHPGPVVRAAAVLVGKRRIAWALPALLRALLETPREADWSAVSRALAILGDPGAVPTLVAVVEAAPTATARDRVARHGLAPLLGVVFEPDLDWRELFERNRDRLGDAGALPIPNVRPRAAGPGSLQETPR